MVLHMSSETVSFWTPPPACLLSGPPAAPGALNNIRSKMIRYRPASIKYSRRTKKAAGSVNGCVDLATAGAMAGAGEKSHLPTASGQKMNECLLSTVGDWDFNVFNLDKLTNGRSLFHLTLHLFQVHDLINIFKLDIVKLMRCITLIEEGYHSSNPYHNAVHAADVVQAMHVFLQESRVAASVTPLERLTALLAAATHDLDHPGVNQAFLIATGNHLAALYNNASVLENHHWRSAVGVIREAGLLDHFPADAWSLVESQLRSLILATDITRQPEFLGKFKSHMDADDLDLSQQGQRFFLLQIALKCADISNPCRPWSVSKRWSHQVCDEFFKQGDYERKLHLPVTSLCDRTSTTVARIQIGFMKFVVQPLFREWQRFNDSALSEQLLANVAQNEQKWGSIEAGEDDRSDVLKALPFTLKFHSIGRCTKTSCISRTSTTVKKDNSASERGSSGSDSGSSSPRDSPSPPPPTMAQQQYPRRHSMPKVSPLPGTVALAPSSSAAAGLRRHSLPIVVALSVPVDKISDKLAMIAECMPTAAKHSRSQRGGGAGTTTTNGNKKTSLLLESFRTNITQLGQSLDEHALENAIERGSMAGSTITSAHGLDQLLASCSASSSSQKLHKQKGDRGSSASSSCTSVDNNKGGKLLSSSHQNCRKLSGGGAGGGGVGGVLETVKLHLPSQPLRRASVPYDRSVSSSANADNDDTQPLLMTIQPPGDMLARRHSDVPRSPASLTTCYFSSACNSLLTVTKSNSGGGGGGSSSSGGGHAGGSGADSGTTPLLLASHDSLTSLQV